jgi:hypothetical protein
VNSLVLSMLNFSLQVNLVVLVLPAAFTCHQCAPEAPVTKQRIRKHQRDFSFFLARRQ